jgi:hypothetical protein
MVVGRLCYYSTSAPTLKLPSFLEYRTNNRATMNRVEGVVIETVTKLMNEISSPHSCGG